MDNKTYTGVNGETYEFELQDVDYGKAFGDSDQLVAVSAVSRVVKVASKFIEPIRNFQLKFMEKRIAAKGEAISKQTQNINKIEEQIAGIETEQAKLDVSIDLSTENAAVQETSGAYHSLALLHEQREFGQPILLKLKEEKIVKAIDKKSRLEASFKKLISKYENLASKIEENKNETNPVLDKLNEIDRQEQQPARVAKLTGVIVHSVDGINKSIELVFESGRTITHSYQDQYMTELSNRFPDLKPTYDDVKTKAKEVTVSLKPQPIMEMPVTIENTATPIMPEIKPAEITKIETVSEPVVELPKIEEPVIELPKVEEPVVELPKEEVKVEPTAIEEPVVELPKEEVKVEPTAIEEPKTEPVKEEVKVESSPLQSIIDKITEMNAKNAELSDANQKLIDENKNLSNQNQTLNGMVVEVQKTALTLETKEKELNQKEQDINIKMDEVAAKAEKNAQLEMSFAARENDIVARQTELNNKEAAVNAQSAELANREQAVAEREVAQNNREEEFKKQMSIMIEKEVQARMAEYFKQLEEHLNGQVQTR